MSRETENRTNRDTINTIIISIFASAILGLGGSHIYVLNKLAANEVRISQTEEAVRKSDSRYLEILGKINESNLKLERLMSEIKQLNKQKSNEDR
jgi:hypothetical protein